MEHPHSVPEVQPDDQPELIHGYVEAEGTSYQGPRRTLKHGDTFAVSDAHGDIGFMGGGPEGIFFRDTRHLSRFKLMLEGQRPLLLASVLQDDNAELSVDLANPDVDPEKDWGLPRDLIALHRTKFLWNDTCYERIKLRNYDERERRFRLEFRFDADFRDLFEVRGMERKRRGSRSVEVTGPDSVQFTYDGLDGIRRITVLRFDPVPVKLETHRAVYEIVLPADGTKSIFSVVSCEVGTTPNKDVPSFLPAYWSSRRTRRARTQGLATVQTSNDLLNEVLCRSASDLAMLMTPTEHGPYPYAGVPWYSTVFGRDGLITALLLLWVSPSVAKAVLQCLASTQATAFDTAADAQPGKILHERRQGEMATLGEVPFRQYYGSVDATPLFIILAGRYFEQTGDRATIEALWPNIKAALHWCDHFGDRDGDGFVEYYRESENGLVNQGWKDSHDSVFHADGRLAEGPIALCEVQGYVYAAKRAGANLAREFGDWTFAVALKQEADRLRDRFEKAFWCEDIGTYALALDGEKRPCKVRTSNAGHLLFTGIARPDRARRVAKQLLGEAFFSRWGIRTVAQGEARYNPMSYHNGSIWPHDNAIIAMGLSRYGFKKQAARVFEALFDAAIYHELRRLPELFCGFIRRPRRGPTAYPVACSPQAWSAATPFALLAACLGLELDRREDEIRFINPAMPSFLNEVILCDLRLGDSHVDARLLRYGQDVTVNVLRREGTSRVILSK